jgi:hydroxyacylglutathione hydrolase
VYRSGTRSAAIYGIPFEQPLDPDEELAEGQILRLGSLSFEVLHTPGHSPGHVIFIGHGAMLGGDLLFAGSIGRTDLPLCSPRDMGRSLARAADLDGATVVFPGHGPSTTIAAEREQNPFLSGAARLVTR